MISPALAIQRSIRARLIADPAVTNLVAPDRIVSSSGLPEGPFPCILFDGGQEVALGEVTRRHFETYTDLHIWCDEPGTAMVREIGGALFGCLVEELTPVPGIVLHDARFSGAKYLRDPGGRLSHGILTLKCIVETQL